MALLSIERYRQLTADTTTDDDVVTQAIADATGLIEAELGRDLESAERIETVMVERLYNGLDERCYPSVTPITEVPDGWTIHGNAVTTGSSLGFGDLPGPFFSDEFAYTVDLTYTGGWTAENLPMPLVFAIARVARNLTTIGVGALAFSGAPEGATTIKVGDVSVGFGASGATSAGDSFGLAPISDSICKAIAPYRRRRL